jgi:hypothetical protein
MSIFGIIAICILIAILISMVAWMIFNETDLYYDHPFLVSVILTIILTIAGTFIGIGSYTECENVYIKQYLAQKETIELSLANEDLTGLERAQLVNKAAELNGELAARKATVDLWHVVVYDETMYDNIEPIDLAIGSK